MKSVLFVAKNLLKLMQYLICYEYDFSVLILFDKHVHGSCHMVNIISASHDFQSTFKYMNPFDSHQILRN